MDSIEDPLDVVVEITKSERAILAGEYGGVTFKQYMPQATAFTTATTTPTTTTTTTKNKNGNNNGNNNGNSGRGSRRDEALGRVLFFVFFKKQSKFNRIFVIFLLFFLLHAECQRSEFRLHVKGYGTIGFLPPVRRLRQRLPDDVPLRIAAPLLHLRIAVHRLQGAHPQPAVPAMLPVDAALRDRRELSGLQPEGAHGFREALVFHRAPATTIPADPFSFHAPARALSMGGAFCNCLSIVGVASAGSVGGV